MNKIVSLVLLLLTISANLLAQAPSQSVEMADQLRTDGKIYVVVLVILIVLIGMFVYLTRLDRKVSKLEKEVKQ